MKNILLKLSVAIIAIFIFIGGGLFVNAQNNTSADYNKEIMSMSYDQNGDIRMNTNFNNDRFGEKNFYKNNFMHNDSFFNLIPWFAGLGVIFTIFGLILIAFWVWMLIHAIKKDIDYKPVWILVLWFMNIFGAIIYYFAVKRTYIEYEDLENVCVCGQDGECVCGPVKSEEVEKIKEELNN